MNDLIGLPEAAKLLGVSRGTGWLMYKSGKLQPVVMTGTALRPRPLFSRAYIEKLAESAAASKAHKAA